MNAVSSIGIICKRTSLDVEWEWGGLEVSSWPSQGNTGVLWIFLVWFSLVSFKREGNLHTL